MFQIVLYFVLSTHTVGTLLLHRRSLDTFYSIYDTVLVQQKHAVRRTMYEAIYFFYKQKQIQTYTLKPIFVPFTSWKWNNVEISYVWYVAYINADFWSKMVIIQTHRKTRYFGRMWYIVISFYIDGSVQDHSISTANTLQILQSSTCRIVWRKVLKFKTVARLQQTSTPFHSPGFMCCCLITWCETWWRRIDRSISVEMLLYARLLVLWYKLQFPLYLFLFVVTLGWLLA